MNKSYWIGPYDIRVPDNTYFVPAEDGQNSIDKWGGCTTEIYCTKELTKDEYIGKYCYLGNDGYYYYDARIKYYNNDSCCTLL